MAGIPEPRNVSPILKLYIKPGCPWCMQATAWLDNGNYRYEKIDVIADDDAFAEMKELSGQSLAPTLVVNQGDPENERVLPDFDVAELRAFLEAEGIEPVQP